MDCLPKLYGSHLYRKGKTDVPPGSLVSVLFQAAGWTDSFGHKFLLHPVAVILHHTRPNTLDRQEEAATEDLESKDEDDQEEQADEDD